jgi:MSHA biogenesis protein MshP
VTFLFGFCEESPGGPGVIRRLQRGFSAITAIFLLVVLAALGAFMLTISGTQHVSSALDVEGVRVYQAARAGAEWAAYHVLDPNSAPGPTCGPSHALASCPTSPTHLSSLAGSLSSYAVSVQCTEATTTEGNRDIRVYEIVATACNKPTLGSCLATTATTGYVERKITARLSKCWDTTATTARCSCG